MRRAAFTAVLLAAHLASAAPHGAKAKADFQRGAKAYQKGDYAAAAAAFEDSFRAEEDVETLFAWAQSERQQDHCEAAIRLYRRLDDFTLPAKNREVIIAKRKECQAILEAAKPDVTPEPEPKHPPKLPKPPPVEEPRREPEPEQPRVRHRADELAWWHDGTGDTLAVTGVVGLGLGGTFLALSYRASRSNATYGDFKAAPLRAEIFGGLGLGFSALGVVTGILAIVHYSNFHERASTEVSGWASPGGGGLALVGRF